MSINELNDEQVRSALALLPSWVGSAGRLERTVLAAPPQTELLRAQVAQAAEEADHHPVVEDVDGGTHFALWTHSAGGVTAKDTALAARIDAIATSLGL